MEREEEEEDEHMPTTTIVAARRGGDETLRCATCHKPTTAAVPPRLGSLGNVKRWSFFFNSESTPFRDAKERSIFEYFLRAHGRLGAYGRRDTPETAKFFIIQLYVLLEYCHFCHTEAGEKCPLPPLDFTTGWLTKVEEARLKEYLIWNGSFHPREGKRDEKYYDASFARWPQMIARHSIFWTLAKLGFDRGAEGNRLRLIPHELGILTPSIFPPPEGMTKEILLQGLDATRRWVIPPEWTAGPMANTGKRLTSKSKQPENQYPAANYVQETTASLKKKIAEASVGSSKYTKLTQELEDHRAYFDLMPDPPYKFSATFVITVDAFINSEDIKGLEIFYKFAECPKNHPKRIEAKNLIGKLKQKRFLQTQNLSEDVLKNRIDAFVEAQKLDNEIEIMQRKYAVGVQENYFKRLMNRMQFRYNKLKEANPSLVKKYGTLLWPIRLGGGTVYPRDYTEPFPEDDEYYLRRYNEMRRPDEASGKDVWEPLLLYLYTLDRKSSKVLEVDTPY